MKVGDVYEFPTWDQILTVDSIIPFRARWKNGSTGLPIETFESFIAVGKMVLKNNKSQDFQDIYTKLSENE
jgi:hypothetical protein